MRAREFVEDSEQHAMVPPLQQQIELQKAAGGKHSEVIDDLTADEEPEHDSDSDSEHNKDAPTESEDLLAYTVDHYSTPPW